MRLKPAIFVLIGLLIQAGAFSPAHAQKTYTRISLEDFERSLGALSQDMNEEYLEILEDLQDVLSDYGEYLDDLAEEEPDHQFPTFDRLQKNLKEGDYLGDPEKLLSDINDVIDEIKEVESRHRALYNTNSPKCCRLPRSLRKELVSTYEIIEDYTDQYGGAMLRGGQLRTYIDATKEYLQALDSQGDLAKLFDENPELLRTLEALKALNLNDYIDLESLKELRNVKLPVAPRPPEPPEPPVVIIDRGDGTRWVTPAPKGRVGAQHQSQGIVLVGDRARTIEIENHTGQIVITGAETDQITATYWIEVSASSREKEKEFIDRATLAVGDDGRKYFVSVDLPRLSDLRTDLIKSVLVVEVPASNPILCHNSFGEVEVRSLKNMLTVEAENSSVNVADIKGKVTIENRMGPITLTGISGDVNVANAYAPIHLADCRGRLKLINEYGQIELADCRGQVEIDNTGEISVVDHAGNIVIENQYGTIELESIHGDLSVRGGYQPIQVSGIDGTVALENVYSEISADNIRGRLSITNDHGPVYIEDLDGPVDVFNRSGNTSIVLTPDFKGGSQITSDAGTVTISFSSQPNLVLALSCDGGAITSSLPISVKTRNYTKTAELVLGEGGDRLEVSATGSSIIIQGR
jgi:DUF4097 and DUF4098 domain-containing protein YvlB